MGRKALSFEERQFPTTPVSFQFWMVFVQWKCRGKMLNRGWLQKERFCECSDNPATGKHYSSVGQAERARKNLRDYYGDDYITHTIEFSAAQAGQPGKEYNMTDDMKEAGFKEAAEAIDIKFVPNKLEFEPANYGYKIPPKLNWHQDGCCDCGLELLSSVGPDMETLRIKFGWDSFMGMRGDSIIQEMDINLKTHGDTEFHLFFNPKTRRLILSKTEDEHNEV